MTTPSFLTGKLALVTGGSGTIGRAIAKALLTSGADVILTARRVEKLEAAKEELLSGLTEQSNVPKVHVLPSDVSSEESVVSLFQSIDGLKAQGVDLLVNNAGIAVPGPTDELTAADMERVLSVNVVGPFLCAREAIKRMKLAGGGRVINIASISSMAPRPNSATYTTSKYAIQGLSRSLALDARPYNIAVGAIHPGNVMSELLTPEEVAMREEAEGFMQAEDVASCVLTMASLPYSSNILDLTVMPTRQPLVGRG